MRAGDFTDRGVHTMKGKMRTVFETPLLSAMRCRRCRGKGVSVTAITEDNKLLGWCCLPHARADGLRLPHRAETTSRARVPR